MPLDTKVWETGAILEISFRIPIYTSVVRERLLSPNLSVVLGPNTRSEARPETIAFQLGLTSTLRGNSTALSGRRSGPKILT